MGKSKDNRTYLADILEACGKILKFTEGYDEAQFAVDEMSQSAVIYQLGVIGEATKQLDMDFRDLHPEIEWRLMAGMRDRLFHGYDYTNYKIIWKTVEADIPILIKQLQPLLADEELPE